VFRRTYKREVPDGAETVIRQGKPHARWRDAHNRVRVAPLSEDGKSIILQARTWTIAYVDAAGKRQQVKGFVDRDATEKKARDLEKQAALIRSGVLAHDADKSTMPIRQALSAWLDDLRRQECSPRYVRSMNSQMLRMIENCGWHALASIGSATLTAWLATPEIKGLAGRTKNQFLETAQTFCIWCTKQRPLPWLAANPLQHVARADESEKRNLRYALTLEELARLKDVCGPRWPVYLTAVLTGLRRSELRALRWSDVHLDVDKPFIQLRAKTTKARRADVIALPAQLVETLRSLPSGDGPVFLTLPAYGTVKADFRRAAIPWVDAQGRKGGLHALRKTYATMLNLSDTPVRTAMEMMRVTDVRLLHDVYNDAKLHNLSAAAERLPRIGGKENKGRARDARRDTGL
jgi:integrase